ncbi:MAG: hypothetical protein ACR2PW_04170 [Gammaproteobacteria bacterium]
MRTCLKHLLLIPLLTSCVHVASDVEAERQLQIQLNRLGIATTQAKHGQHLPVCEVTQADLSVLLPSADQRYFDPAQPRQGLRHFCLSAQRADAEARAKTASIQAGQRLQQDAPCPQDRYLYKLDQVGNQAELIELAAVWLAADEHNTLRIQAWQSLIYLRNRHCYLGAGLEGLKPSCALRLVEEAAEGEWATLSRFWHHLTAGHNSVLTGRWRSCAAIWERRSRVTDGFL